MSTKKLAEDYFNRIQSGHNNAIGRPSSSSVDRALRKMIEDANNHGDCIINVGNGIFRPVSTDPVDCYYFDSYIANEKARSRSLGRKIAAMTKTFLVESVEAEYEQYRV